MRAIPYFFAALFALLVISGCQPGEVCVFNPSALPSKPDPTEYHSDTAGVAAAAGEDYPMLRLNALKGDGASLRKIFWLTKHAGFDAASAEGNSMYLGELLRRTGDDYFGGQLRKEPRDVRDSVQEMVLWDFGWQNTDITVEEIKDWYPKSFKGYQPEEY